MTDITPQGAGNLKAAAELIASHPLNSGGAFDPIIETLMNLVKMRVHAHDCTEDQIYCAVRDKWDAIISREQALLDLSFLECESSEEVSMRDNHDAATAAGEG